MSINLRGVSTMETAWWARLPMTMMYLSFSGAGAMYLWAAAVSPTIEETLSVAGAAVWAGFLFVGGLVSGLSQHPAVWVAEAIGLPLLLAAMFVFGIALMAVDSGRTDSSRFVLGILFCGIGFALLARMGEVAAGMRLHRNMARAGELGEGN